MAEGRIRRAGFLRERAGPLLVPAAHRNRSSRRPPRVRLRPVGHVELHSVGVVLPDGRPLLHDVSFRVGEGTKTALVGANGARARRRSCGSSPATQSRSTDGSPEAAVSG
jgi:ATPase subunit of ABC transporter with duplicated ATPase domains